MTLKKSKKTKHSTGAEWIEAICSIENCIRNKKSNQVERFEFSIDIQSQLMEHNFSK